MLVEETIHRIVIRVRDHAIEGNEVYMTFPDPAVEVDAIDRPEPNISDISEQADDLSLVRDLVIKAHSDVVPELIFGDSVASIIASIGPSQAAYSKLMAKIQAASEPEAFRSNVPHVPSGSTLSAPIDLDRLTTAEKLRRGVQDQASRAGR